MDRITFNKLNQYIFHPHLRHMSDWYLSFYLFKNGEEAVHFDESCFLNIERPNNFKIDKCTHDFRSENKFGEAYINLYRLIKTFELREYNWSESGIGYLTEKRICKAIFMYNYDKFIQHKMLADYYYHCIEKNDIC